MDDFRLIRAMRNAPLTIQFLVLLLAGGVLVWFVGQRDLIANVTHFLQSMPVILVLPPLPTRKKATLKQDTLDQTPLQQS